MGFRDSEARPSNEASAIMGINNTSGNLLRIRDAVVRRSGKVILDIDRFDVEEGRSLAILGPNGAGKTTFVNLVTREVMPLHRDEPPIVFRGQPRMTLADTKRCTGIVSSSMQKQISVPLPAIEIVIGGLYGSLGIPLRAKATESQHAKAMHVLEELGIADLADRKMNTLSTGQARRVLVARAMVHDPDILIFDEPCSGLDPQGMYWLRRTMSKLAEDGRTILLVTHYPEDIVPEIEDVLLLKDGRVYARGPKKELLTTECMRKLFDVPLEVVKTNRDTYLLEL